MIRKTLATAGAAAVLVAGVAAAAPASAKAVVQKSGTCSSAAVTWKLKAKPDNGRIEVEFEVDSNRNGQRWHWSMKDNKVVVGSGNATTVAPSGSFTVRRLIPNRAGADRIGAGAKLGTITCGGVVTL